MGLFYNAPKLTRGGRWLNKGNNGWGAGYTCTLNTDQVVYVDNQVGWLQEFYRWEWDEFVFNVCINLELVQRSENGCNMRSFNHSTCLRVLNLSRAIYLSMREENIAKFLNYHNFGDPKRTSLHQTVVHFIVPEFTLNIQACCPVQVEWKPRIGAVLAFCASYSLPLNDIGLTEGLSAML